MIRTLLILLVIVTSPRALQAGESTEAADMARSPTRARNI